VFDVVVVVTALGVAVVVLGFAVVPAGGVVAGLAGTFHHVDSLAGWLCRMKFRGTLSRVSMK
jgi:hypothetical protein